LARLNLALVGADLLPALIELTLFGRAALPVLLANLGALVELLPDRRVGTKTFVSAERRAKI